MGVNQRLEQRIAGQAIGAMEPCAGGFTDGIQPLDVGPAVNIRDHPAAHIVGRGHHRNRFSGHVDVEFQTFFIQIGEP